MSPKVEIKVEGQKIGGWIDVRLSRSMTDLAWGFTMGVYDRWSVAPPASTQFPFEEGLACEVFVDDALAFTGYIDTARIEYNDSSHSVSLSGRSKSGDLVDCSHIGQKKWKEATALQIAKKLCDPFGITITASTSVPTNFHQPFKSFSVEEGETVFDTLERICKYKAVLCVSDTKGNLEFTSVGAKRAGTKLVFGDRRILSAVRDSSGAARFSKYIIKKQTKGNDTWNGDVAAKGTYVIEDTAVGRYRPITILPDGRGHKKELEDRGKWEKNTRAGRSETLQYTLQDWYATPGQLWLPNTLVELDDEKTGAIGPLLIQSVELMLGADGCRAGLEIVHPSTFDILVPVPKKGRKQGKQGKYGKYSSKLDGTGA